MRSGRAMKRGYFKMIQESRSDPILPVQGRNSLQAGSGREVRAEMDGDGYDVIVNLKRGKRFMPGSTAS